MRLWSVIELLHKLSSSTNDGQHMRHTTMPLCHVHIWDLLSHAPCVQPTHCTPLRTSHSCSCCCVSLSCVSHTEFLTTHHTNNRSLCQSSRTALTMAPALHTLRSWSSGTRKTPPAWTRHGACSSRPWVSAWFVGFERFQLNMGLLVCFRFEIDAHGRGESVEDG